MPGVAVDDNTWPIGTNDGQCLKRLLLHVRLHTLSFAIDSIKLTGKLLCLHGIVSKQAFDAKTYIF